ncbi:DUF4386 domain-containing protein [Wenyingzhuangia marina]|uniref:DUF4386 domain-containing protein n=1 Tax=Wenyingzhuangia marina TaxID=1195760 RepID=A0A1M5SDP5_9FLAO|nr:DUF4386 domain-containing protein [Wenyingzhuangia marina]GGF61846.1 hypothetical protein GCM10011397_01210 [Wenyingzhuangia marina]SHH36727.1 protein of unknown function [Wenyingzhuangia marina]
MKNQKIIGLLYLSIAIIGGFSMGYAPIELIDIHNLSLTFHNIQENLLLFKLSILGDGIVIVLELFITILLYHFFKQTDTLWSEIAKYSRLAMALIMAINILYYIIPLHNMRITNTSVEFFNFCIQAHFYTVYIWQVFFGIHMIALSVLTCKHPQFSKILSFLLLLGGIGYLLDCIVYFVGIENTIFTTSANILLGVAAVSELSFAVLLLIKKSKI